MEAHALRKRGWTISAIARHLERDRKTVRAYLNDERAPGVRASSAPDPLALYEAYLRARFEDDCHLWLTALYDEVKELGYCLSYPSFARQVRTRGLRPHCEACSGVKGRDTIEIDHPPGEEIQWDWFERRNAPWGQTAYILLGTLSYSGRVRGVVAESLEQAHLIEAMAGVMERLGGTTRVWRTDRMATVIVPGTRKLQESFSPVAKHYGAVVEPCPPRRGNRKGKVENSGKFVSGRWWRTMTATTLEEAQVALDRFCATTGDARDRWQNGEKATVGELAAAEPLRPLPAAAYPATIVVERTVAVNATVAFRGNTYSVPPGLSGSVLEVSHRLGTTTLEVRSPTGALLVTHRLAPPGAHALVRTPEHRRALEAAVLSSFTTAGPCDKKSNRPPGNDALRERARLLGDEGREVTVDLSRYDDLTWTGS